MNSHKPRIAPRAVRLRRRKIKRALTKVGLAVSGLAVLGLIGYEACNRIDTPEVGTKHGVKGESRFRNDISTTNAREDSPTNMGRGYEVDYSSHGIYRKEFYDMNGHLQFEGLGSNAVRYFKYYDSGMIFVKETRKQGEGWIHVKTYVGAEASNVWREATVAYGN